jgi:hypothetical protein
VANSITPPPELVQQWEEQFLERPTINGCFIQSYIATKAAQWGADQELEACCEEMKSLPSPLGIPFGEMASNALRAARRPKPPSLKEQAMEALDRMDQLPTKEDQHIIRRALEALDD